jgi:hypothetical protein
VTHPTHYFVDHPVPVAAVRVTGVFDKAAVLAIVDQLERVVEVKLVSYVSDEVDAEPLEPVVARQLLGRLLEHGVWRALQNGDGNSFSIGMKDTAIIRQYRTIKMLFEAVKSRIG